ncbi:MAG: glycosyltransferase family 4 protein [Thainema sp.]
MKVLFLDQSNSLGGAELCLADIVQSFNKGALVGVFNEGAFPEYLRQLNIPVQVLMEEAITVRKDSHLLAGLKSLRQLLPLIFNIVQISQKYDLLYINTPKALIAGAVASFLSGRLFVYHLHDIVSPEHFSITNRRILVTLANRASLIIANSEASREAFIKAGGQSNLVHVVHNGFRAEDYDVAESAYQQLRRELKLSDKFVVGSFSRLSPWKGQHVLIEALTHCPNNVVVLLVGDALFGEHDYVAELHRLIQVYNLHDRVHFLGFRSDIAPLMHACDVVAHTSTFPEPFGRVIVEAMLCGTPVVATAAGGALELIDHSYTGWLYSPGNSEKLGDLINYCAKNPEAIQNVAAAAKEIAGSKYRISRINGQIKKLLRNII